MSASPFKFLDSYTSADIGSYFGRERETDELFRRCFLSSTLVVYGGSGTGKTSLVQCGLASRFQESDWLPVPVRRSGEMLASLTEAVREHTLTPKHTGDLNELVTNLYLDHFKPIWFIFDQFEELFIFGGHAESQAFFTALKAVLEREKNARAIFVVREEYLAELTRYERIIPGLIENRYRVERLSHGHAMSVVEQLCGAHGIACAEGFAAALVERLDPEGQGIELSYLQVYLDRCWRIRQNEEPFSPELLERIGHVDDLLGAFLDEQVADTPEPQRAEALLKTFVSDQGTKRQLNAAEALEWVNTIGTPMEGTDVERLLQVFVTKRLLKDRDERGRYELLHDALARQIFQRITRAEQELIEVRQFVEQAHGQFQKRGVRLTPNDLAYLRPYRQQLHLKGGMKAFVEIAFGEAERKDRRRRVRVRALVVVLLVVLVVGVKLIVDLRDSLEEERNRLFSGRLVEFAMATVDEDPHLAYLAAERAYELDSSLAASRAVMRCYNNLYPFLAKFKGTIARVSKDKRKFLIIEPGKGFTVHDLNGTVLFRKELKGFELDEIYFTSSGNYVFCADSTINLFDMTGTSVFTCELAARVRVAQERQFILAFSDSLLIETPVGVKTFQCPNVEALQKNGFGQVGSLSDGTIYLCDTDSLRLFFLTDDSLRNLMTLALPKFADGSIWLSDNRFRSVHGLHGRIFLRSKSGGVLFDPLKRSWQPLRSSKQDEFILSYVFDDAILVQANVNDASPFIEVYRADHDWSMAYRLEGKLMAYFPEAGTALLVPNRTAYSPTRLCAADGNLIRSIPGIAVAFDAHGFVTLSDSTMIRDELRAWDAHGRLLSERATARAMEPVHGMLNSRAFIDHAGGQVLWGYLSETAVNNQKLAAMRCVRNDSTILQVAMQPRSSMHRQRLVHALDSGRVLVAAGSNGHMLTEGFKAHPLVRAPMKSLGMNRIDLQPYGYFMPNYFVPEDAKDKHGGMRYIGFARWGKEGYSEGELVYPYKSDSRLSYSVRPAGDLYTMQWRLGEQIQNITWVDSVRVHVHSLLDGTELRRPILRRIEQLHWGGYGSKGCVLVNEDSLWLFTPWIDTLVSQIAATGAEKISLAHDRRLVFRDSTGFLLVDMISLQLHRLPIDSLAVDERLRGKGNWRNPLRAFAPDDSTLILYRTWRTGGTLLQAFRGKRALGVQQLLGESEVFERSGRIFVKSRMNVVTEEAEIFLGWSSAVHSEDVMMISYFEVVLRNGFLQLESSTIQAAEPTARYSLRDGLLHDWAEELLRVEGDLFDANLSNRVLAAHRFLNYYEQFPSSPREAIRMVRDEKVYGEFWKHIDAEGLIRKRLLWED